MTGGVTDAGKNRFGSEFVVAAAEEELAPFMQHESGGIDNGGGGVGSGNSSSSIIPSSSSSLLSLWLSSECELLCTADGRRVRTREGGGKLARKNRKTQQKQS